MQMNFIRKHSKALVALTVLGLCFLQAKLVTDFIVRVMDGGTLDLFHGLLIVGSLFSLVAFPMIFALNFVK